MRNLIFRIRNLPFPWMYPAEEEDVKLWALAIAVLLVDSWLIVECMILIHKSLSTW